MRLTTHSTFLYLRMWDLCGVHAVRHGYLAKKVRLHWRLWRLVVRNNFLMPDKPGGPHKHQFRLPSVPLRNNPKQVGLRK